MPIGPSHSSHSNGSSHSSSHGFGGGSRGFGAGSRGSYTPRPRHPMTFRFFGRPVVFSVGTQNVLGGLFIFFAFLVVITIAMFGAFAAESNSLRKGYESIKIYEQDAVYYSDMIAKAKAGEDGYKTATATFDKQFYYYYDEEDFEETGIFEYEEINNVTYFFINYSYFNELNGQQMMGQTYTQFTSGQVMSMISGQSEGKINIAYCYDEQDGAYYSMNIDYSLDKNQDYKALKIEVDESEVAKKVFLTIALVASAIDVILIVSIVFVIRKTIKKSKMQAEVDAEKSKAEIAQAQAEARKAEEENVSRMCEYCGSYIPENEKKCPACGSRVFKKVK